MVRRHAVEFRQCRETRRRWCRRELVDVETADRGDPLAIIQAIRALFYCRQHFIDGAGILQPGVMAWPEAEQHDVIVVVYEAWHDRAAFQVDGAGAGCYWRSVISDDHVTHHAFGADNTVANDAQVVHAAVASV